MARKTKTDPEDTPASRETDSDKKLLLELRDRYKKCVDADRENRNKYKANMRFTLVPGEQWDETSKKERGKDRVMYEFNETRIKCKAVVNQIRANRPSAKITPAEDGDVELAEAMKGLIDQIQNASDADSVMDYATEHQVIGGMGAERYITRYCDDSVDRQEIVIEPVKNPMCLYADHACQKQDKSDARYWILASKLSKEVFKARYPKAKPVEFDVEDEFDDDCDEDHVWVAEYWKQRPITRNLALLSDGKTVDLDKIKALPDGITVVKTRAVPSHEIIQYICSGDAVLTDDEGNKEHLWAGKEFPFNIVYGEYSVVDGKEVWYGLPEHGKDAQRAHNWAATSVYEAIASAPQGTTWVTEKQAEGLLAEWAEAQRKNLRIKRYNHDSNAPGPPTEVPPATIPTALMAAFEMSSNSLKAVLGMPDSTLGEKGAENSGIAIRRRQEAGAVANFNFGDNVTKFVRRRMTVLMDLIPNVYDTPRQIRVLGKDGAEKWIKINDLDPVTGERINDLSAAKFDLVVTQGPNFATQRQEAAETYMGMMQTNPLLAQGAPDLIFKALDLPYSQEISERMKALLPPPIQAMLNKDQDPAVVAAMQQVEAAMAQVQEQQALVQQAAQEAQSEQQDASKAKSEVQVAAANLKVQEAQLALKEAQLDTAVAEFQRMVAEQQAKDANEQIGKSEQNAAESSDQRDAILQHVQQIIEQLSMGAGLIAQTQQQQIDNLRGLVEPPPPPVVESKQARTVKENGGYTTTIDGESGSQQVRTEKGPDGELVTVTGDRILTTKREGNSFVTTVTPVTMQ